MRTAAKVDTNQGDIVRALRKAGCNVLSLAAVGNGCPDLLACRAEQLHLLEIKDGDKSASRRKLTPHQIQFHAAWPVHIVTTEIEALQIIQALNESHKRQSPDRQ